MAARTPTRVHRPGVEQRADLAERRRAGRGSADHRSERSPASGLSSPRISLIVVDFPAPFGPTKPVTRPGSDAERQAVDGDGAARTAS